MESSQRERKGRKEGAFVFFSLAQCVRVYVSSYLALVDESQEQLILSGHDHLVIRCFHHGESDDTFPVLCFQGERLLVTIYQLHCRQVFKFLRLGFELHRGQVVDIIHACNVTQQGNLGGVYAKRGLGLR